MDNKRLSLTKNILVSLMGFSTLFLTPPAYAANATMNLNPATGSHNVGGSLSVDLVIDGQGEAFNAAKATVEVSSALQINDIFLGDCNFSFITTPTTANPSFVGAILGDSSGQCTVYTLSLTPVQSGSGLITLSAASVKKFGNAEEILQTVQSGTYTLNSATGSSSQQDTATSTHSTTTESSIQEIPALESDSGLVTTIIKVVDSNNNPISGATVLINPSSSEPDQNQTNNSFSIQSNGQQSEDANPASQPQFQTTTDESGIAQITNVPPGVHTIEIKDDEKVIASKIVNVPANEGVMRLGIQEQKEAIGWAQMAIIIITVLAMVAVVIIYLRKYLFKLLQRLVGKA